MEFSERPTVQSLVNHAVTRKRLSDERSYSSSDTTPETLFVFQEKFAERVGEKESMEGRERSKLGYSGALYLHCALLFLEECFS